MSIAINLQEKQRASIIRMLNLNERASSSNNLGNAFSASMGNTMGAGNDDEWGEEWKVVVYDKHCRDIISPLLNVGALRKQGVTLHMLLGSSREAITDVPAVYFCQATTENIDLLARDASQGLYAGMHLNFCSKLGRTQMEDLAKKTLKTRSVHNINKIFDQYLDFISLESSLFSLGFPECYGLYNSPSTPEREIEEAMRRVAFGLFSVVATLGVVPIIRAAPGGPAEMVARQLNSMVSDHLASPNTPFFRAQPQASQGQDSLATLMRPLLVIMDRNADLVTPLHHSSTYQALLDDTLPQRLNRVKISTEDNEKNYDLDKNTDKFFKRYAGRPFPEAIEANGQELSEVSKKEAELRKRTSASGEEKADLQTPPSSQKNGEDLLATIDSLPMIMERKKLLEAHTNILQAIMKVVSSREIPYFFELEEEMVTNQRVDKAQLSALLSDGSKGSLKDKLRLLGVYSLATDASSQEFQEMESKLRESYEEGTAPAELEAGIKVITYLRRQRSLQHLPIGAQADNNMESKDGDTSSASLSSFIGKGVSQATGLLSKARDQVSNILVRNQRLYISRVVESLCEQKASPEAETYLYLDPKTKKLDPEAAKASRGTSPFQQVIAFVIGGGCYSEYQNLQDLAASTNSSAKTIIYGCTELQNAEAFLSQLEELSS